MADSRYLAAAVMTFVALALTVDFRRDPHEVAVYLVAAAVAAGVWPIAIGVVLAQTVWKIAMRQWNRY
jgi:hypothetical protein